MKFDCITKEGIDSLMDIFYNKIRSDKSGLGDIFNTQIGTDEEVWIKHKAKISNFWQGMLLNQGDYNGQPLKAHLDLPPFPREHFDTWLNLFESSLDLVFVESIKQEILQRAKMIASRFIHMLYEMPH